MTILKNGLTTIEKVKADETEFKNNKNKDKTPNMNNFEQREYDDLSQFYKNKGGNNSG